MKKILGLMQLFVGISGFTGSIPILTKSTTNLVSGSGQDFFVQGVLLLLMVAVPNLVASYFALNLHRKTGVLSLIAGVVLLAWVGYHFFTFGYQSFFQIFYLVIAIAELLIVQRIMLADKPKN